MKKVIMCIFIILIALMEMGCEHKERSGYDETQVVKISPSSTENDIKEKSSGYLEKVQLLSNEMKKINSSLSPKDTFNACSLVNKYMEEVLNEKDSLDMQPKDILGVDFNYYIKISEPVAIDKSNYRLIELGLKEIKMGGIAKIYLQSWDDKKNTSVQAIHELNITDSVNNILYSNILNIENDYYIIIAEKLYDTENTYINLNMLKYQGNKWDVYNGINSNIDKANWLLEKYEGGFSITNKMVTDLGEYDYSLNIINNKLVLNIVDKNESVLKMLELNFENGKWINK